MPCALFDGRRSWHVRREFSAGGPGVTLLTDLTYAAPSGPVPADRCANGVINELGSSGFAIPAIVGGGLALRIICTFGSVYVAPFEDRGETVPLMAELLAAASRRLPRCPAAVKPSSLRDRGLGRGDAARRALLVGVRSPIRVAQRGRGAHLLGPGVDGADGILKSSERRWQDFVYDRRRPGRAWHPAFMSSSPDRIRTGVTALRGRRPRPLDDGAVHAISGIQPSRRAEMLAWASAVQTTASPPVRPTGGHAMAGPVSAWDPPDMNKRGREPRPRCD